MDQTNFAGVSLSESSQWGHDEIRVKWGYIWAVQPACGKVVGYDFGDLISVLQ